MITSEDLKVYKKVEKKIREVAAAIADFRDEMFYYDDHFEIPQNEVIFDEFTFPLSYISLSKKEYMKLEQKRSDELAKENSEIDKSYAIKRYQNSLSLLKQNKAELMTLGLNPDDYL